MRRRASKLEVTERRERVERWLLRVGTGTTEEAARVARVRTPAAFADLVAMERAGRIKRRRLRARRTGGWSWVWIATPEVRA